MGWWTVFRNRLNWLGFTDAAPLQRDDFKVCRLVLDFESEPARTARQDCNTDFRVLELESSRRGISGRFLIEGAFLATSEHERPLGLHGVTFASFEPLVRALGWEAKSFDGQTVTFGPTGDPPSPYDAALDIYRFFGVEWTPQRQADALLRLILPAGYAR